MGHWKPSTTVNDPKTSQDDAVREAEKKQLLEAIRRDFAEVRRDGGVSLHETVVLDNYGSDQERLAARELDTDTHWWEVRDEWIEQICGVGGLSFLDDAGFRYYLPAYLSYWVRTDDEPGYLGFHLSGSRKHRFRLFSAAQRATIGRVLSFVYRGHRRR